jgi:outer membrane protein, multidrug efflux system
LESVQFVLEGAKTELAALINLPPGTRFRIAAPSRSAMRLPPLPMSISRMEDTALLLNPDIRELSYEARITAAETRKALLKLIPNLNLTAGPHYDSNSFLVNHSWVAGAAYLNGYLNSLIVAPTLIRRSESAEALTAVRREAVSMAVLTRLHIAVEQYTVASKEYRRATELADVDTRLYQQISNRVATDAQGELEKVSAQVSALYSELRSYQSFAEAQAAIGRLYAALGIDRAPEHGVVLSVLGMNDAVKLAMQDRAPPSAAPPPSPEPTPTPASTGDATPPSPDAAGKDHG